MEILYLLIPLALILVVVIAALFFWSVKSGQMDDLEGPAYRILMDDDGIQSEFSHNEASKKQQNEIRHPPSDQRLVDK